MPTFDIARRKPGLTLSKRKRAPLKVISILAIAVLGFIPLYRAAVVDADWRPTVQIVSPSSTTMNRGHVTLKFKVDGLTTDQYEPFWAVGDGTWNRMNVENGINYAEIDTTYWNWNANNTYTISYIALQKDGWSPIIQKKSFTLTTGTVGSVVTAPAVITLPNQGTVTPAPVPNTPTTPAPKDETASVKSLYVDPESDAQAKARAWVQSHPEDGPVMEKLVSQPLANWYGGWNQDVRADSDRYVTGATAAGQVPVLVAYNIPFRDCGSYSAGGVANSNAYTRWISEFAKGIGGRDAIVLLEPDALPGMDCLPKDAQNDRIEMLRNAVTTLKSTTKAKVYLDAGHPEWKATSVMATRLKQAGIADADGFSLNVSNFTSTEKNITYGKALSQKTDDAHFVIDTSRNGNGSAENLEWCNPTNVKVGINPTLQTGTALVDAYIWVKAPGGSDGTCGSKQLGTSAPAAGEWWPQYALNILK